MKRLLVLLAVLLAAACSDDAPIADASDSSVPFAPSDGGPSADLGGHDATADAGAGQDAAGDTKGGTEDAGAPPDATPDVVVPQDLGTPGAHPDIAVLPIVTLKQGHSTTLDLTPYLSDADDPVADLVVSWKAKQVAIADTGNQVLLIVAPASWAGTEQVPVTVTDPAGHTDTELLTVTVEAGTPPVKPPPPDPTKCGEVELKLAAPGATQVLLAGSFNGWAATPEAAINLFDSDGDGVWATTITVEPGTYQYKFIVDGVWMADPANPQTVDDGFGGVNSVLVVDCGTPKPPCGVVTFSLAAPGASVVLVSGEFNGWGADAGSAWALADSDGDGVWTRTETLEPGSYQYKFIVDGGWIPDPANPKTADDGFGGVNSVLDVACGALSLVSHKTLGGTFEAVFSGADGASVTVDWEPAPLTTVGDEAHLKLDLGPGIHDVRVTSGGETLLLKVYVGVSTDWRDALMYFAMTDRFANGDSGNDAPITDVDWRTNYQGGDFAGITQKIEQGYFDALHVSALWISWPVDNPDFYEDGAFPDQGGCGLGPKSTKFSPMRYTGYHGYWPSQLDQVETRHGTLAELQALVVAAHARGIRVLLDFTANHVHDSSPLYAQQKEWFNLPAEICQDVGWDDKPKTCWFVDYLPDIDYTKPGARAAMLDHVVDWVKATGADGLRFDAVKHLEMSFVQDLRARMKAELELTGIDFYIVGETFTGDAGLIESFVGPSKLHGQFDFPSNLHILKGFATYEEGLDQMDQAIRGIKSQYATPGLMSTFIGNHDIARFASMASGMIPCGPWDVLSNQAQGWLNPPGAATEDGHLRLRLAMMYALTIPGVPLIYYGDEIGMAGAGDPDNRRFMRFDGAVTGLEEETLAYVGKVAEIRAAHPALRTGTWSQPLWSEPDFIAYGRVGDGAAVVLLNRGSSMKSGTLQVGTLGIKDGTKMKDLFYKIDPITVSGGGIPFSLAALSGTIFVMQE
ncbi:MAG: hypothetical protein AMXMBFR64_27660 [Myxococcales bacterium]